jgi:Putative exonuclease SbcCD, C subunit
MTVTSALSMDVLAGVPEPTRERWQPLRAGILNLYLYDEQVFTFHNGRLLLRGNNGTGKSMALEVLLPYLLDAELTPSRLSTFGGNHRNMYLWLIGFDQSGNRSSERAYTWVEFGRRLPGGDCEYFTAGAMLEGTRDSSVTARYFSTAARIGVHMSVGRPGSEPLTTQQLTAELAAQSAAGRPGTVHPTGEAHRTAVNQTLYGLSPQRYAVLRQTLLQLRRPKLSDKLDENGLNKILRDSLPTVSEAIVEDLAEGFERLDRHSAAVEELEKTLGDLRRLRNVYRDYARAASAARADAVAAAESAISTLGEKTTAAESVREAAEAALESIRLRNVEIDASLAEITGRISALTTLDAYTKGQEVEPLRQYVEGLRKTVATAATTADNAETTAAVDAAAADRATDEAISARENCSLDREQAANRAETARADELDAELNVALGTLSHADTPDAETLKTVLDRARDLIGKLETYISTWSDEVKSLCKLSTTASRYRDALETAQGETRRAQAEFDDAEATLNERLEKDTNITLDWISELQQWAEASVQLRIGQTPPLPWDPGTVLERAPRWAAEAAIVRSSALRAEEQEHLTAAANRDQTATAVTGMARLTENVADRIELASDTAAAYDRHVTAYRAEITSWAAAATELSSGAAPPDFGTVSGEEIRQAASGWAVRAHTARAGELLTDRANLEPEMSRISGAINELSLREEHLASGGLPEPEIPATRQVSRENRVGGPFYMLVDFASSVRGEDRLGLEAAALASGIADAWISPDGRLLSGDDGLPLLDTQLDSGTSSPTAGGSTLADVLVPDADSAEIGVPSDIILSVLSRVSCMPSARAAAPPQCLVLGRDGSWRAGTLTGAHRVSDVTFIGASNRESARQDALAKIRRQLVERRAELTQLEWRQSEIDRALARLDVERDDLPPDDSVRTAGDTARQAADRATGTARELRDSLTATPLETPVASEVRQIPPAADLDNSLIELAGRILEEPADAASVVPLRELAMKVDTLAAAWTEAAATRRTKADECQTQLGTVEGERGAIPDDSAVRGARASINAAREQVHHARGRLKGREKEEENARSQATASAGSLRAALLASGLAADCDTWVLDESVRQYQQTAERWLRSGIEQIRTAGAAQHAHARSISSAENASNLRSEADRLRREHVEKKAELDELTRNYGRDYEQIVSELAELEESQQNLGEEKDNLAEHKLAQKSKLTEAETELRGLAEKRTEADTTRATATVGFLAAHRLGLLAVAGYPDAPIGEPSDAEAPSTSPVLSLGVRAARDWARAVRDAAGDKLRRDPETVETVANRVTENRHRLEPDLAGKVSIRDERHDGLLLLEASRGTRSLPLAQMMTAIAEEHFQAQELLAQHEADLFRKFLAESTRREVTNKIRDARTAIRQMSDLMSAHPTGSGIQVSMDWVPDERNAPGMGDIVTLMGKDAPLDSERERLQEFFRGHLAAVRATGDADYTEQMRKLLDYREWRRFTIKFRRGPEQPYQQLTSKTHGALSGGEKAVCLHLPLFAAAASYCDSAGVKATAPDGRKVPGAPRLILLDEVFAGVDEDNRGDLFELIRILDLDLVATSESEQGFYRQIDGLTIYQLVKGDDAVLGTRTIWDGRAAHRLFDPDPLLSPDGGP